MFARVFFFVPPPPLPRRVLTELVSKMRDMQMDKTELGCLRAIVLFNPGNERRRVQPRGGSGGKGQIGARFMPRMCRCGLPFPMITVVWGCWGWGGVLGLLPQTH